MKTKYSLGLLFGLVTLWCSTGCNSVSEEDLLIQDLQTQNNELSLKLDEERESVKSVLLSLNEVQEGMRELTLSQGLLADLTMDEGELARSPKEKVMDDIARIDSLLRQNKERIAALNKKVKSGEGNIAEFKKLVDNLNHTLAEKEGIIADLKGQIVLMEDDYAVLLDSYKQQLSLSGAQDMALNKVFYAIGTQKELEEAGVLEKTGGVLGIGKTKKIKSDFNKNYFTETDMRGLNELSLNAKNMTLLTQHPASSYETVSTEEGGVERLVINDPQSFWSASKYLAVMVK